MPLFKNCELPETALETCMRDMVAEHGEWLVCLEEGRKPANEKKNKKFFTRRKNKNKRPGDKDGNGGGDNNDEINDEDDNTVLVKSASLTHAQAKRAKKNASLKASTLAKLPHRKTVAKEEQERRKKITNIYAEIYHVAQHHSTNIAAFSSSLYALLACNKNIAKLLDERPYIKKTIDSHAAYLCMHPSVARCPALQDYRLPDVTPLIELGRLMVEKCVYEHAVLTSKNPAKFSKLRKERLQSETKVFMNSLLTKRQFSSLPLEWGLREDTSSEKHEREQVEANFRVCGDTIFMFIGFLQANYMQEHAERLLDTLLDFTS